MQIHALATPHQQLFPNKHHKFTQVYEEVNVNDPAEGSPTATLLRLLNPLENKI